MNYSLINDKVHLGILNKFDCLKGNIITNDRVKGGKGCKLKPDKYVGVEHILHDCIRGFYKPQGWECMLSYCATEKEENYGRQIVWKNYEKGEFEKIVMSPPDGEKDNRKTSDIKSAIFAMENKIPIGILYNFEKGKRKVLGLGLIKERDKDGNFIVYPISFKDIEGVKMNNNRYYVFKTSDSELVNNILDDKIEEFEFSALPNYYEEMKEGETVFLVLGGDKPAWDIGLRGIATILKRPYDRGYSVKNKKYFKVILKKNKIFKYSINREKLVPYRGTYNMPFIGPMLKGEPNQANVGVSREQVIAVLKALMDFNECTEKELIKIFGGEIVELSKQYDEIYDKKNSESKEIKNVNRIVDLLDINNLDINYILKYINSKGMTYEQELIKNSLISLKTKPFVILSGISGTGKSKLVKLLAESLGATSENERFILIPVRPDWSDPSELLGYKDLNGTFHPGILTTTIEKAIDDKQNPYFICLDEMNLARVEYYLSDILSVIESRYIDENGDIKTDKLIRKELLGNDQEAIQKYSDIYIPDNLYIIGTVNMDETTFPFSKKVLDRANTIEFNEVNLGFNFDSFEEVPIEQKEFTNNFLKSKYIKLIDCKNEKEQATQIINQLIKINNVLEKYNQHFGYRVRDEIVYYCLYALKDNLFTKEEAMDYCIVQKILPKIGGSDEDTLDLLIELYNELNDTKYTSDNVDELIKLINSNIGSIYKLSTKKILIMVRRFVRDGFTNFWQ
ncbi:AAA domain-containing protein [Paeniclostridium sordellii]|uniref:McrB family protein n=1 Tax=Paraclostridium sordellii TaxID=1505 RepID=UPI00096A73BF|nr:AAA family ATPase [Paeniclostridium sordellii]MBX9180161.1 AAA domain-containing protein [Paeniclostridium sordellii]MVO71504.1 AAA domain-containing protein [Paeniclostridium sordellii]